MNWSKSDQARYEAQTRDELYRSYRLTTLLATLLFPAAFFLDALSPQFVELSEIRFGTAAVFLGLYLASRRRNPRLNPALSCFLVLMLAAISCSWMCLVLGGYTSSYYACVILVMVLSGVLFPWGPRMMALTVGSVSGIYIVMMLVHAHFHITQLPLFLYNVYHLIAIALINVFSAHFLERKRRESFSRLLIAEQAQSKLKEADQLKTQFFSNVSHELRTPVTLILGPTERLLASSDLSAEQERELRVIGGNARSLLRHVNDLLDVARMEAGKTEAQYARLDLVPLLKRTASLFDALAAVQKHAFRIDTPDSLMVEVDPPKLQRVLMNLLGNAFKFSGAEGKIECSLSVDGDRVCFTVSDSGPGVPVHLRESIFERFFQVEESSIRHAGGTGLGLAVVRDFVQLHHGRVWVEESSSGGARFRVDLPIRAPAGVSVRENGETIDEIPHWTLEQMVDELKQVQEKPQEFVPTGARPLVLVVEDNPEMRRYISEAIKPEFEVITASGGEEGLRVAWKHRPDLIVSDLMMPGMSGTQMIKELQAQDETRSIPIIVLSALADVELRTRLLRQGAQDYLVKPFSALEVLARVRNLVTQKRARERLQMDLESRQSDLDTLVAEASQRRKELSRALEDTQTAYRVREEFLKVASHELKTPLTALRLQIDVFKRKSAAPEAFLHALEHQSLRMTQVLEQIFDFTAIEAGRVSLAPTRVQLSDLIHQLVGQFKLSLQRAGRLEPELELDPSIEGHWDRALLEKALGNMISNAVKYGERRPIRIRSARVSDSSVRIEIQDQGLGIPKDSHERIFEAFQREVCANEVSGLGLGLYVARKIVEHHGGRISVQSEVNRGSVFTVELPLWLPTSEKTSLRHPARVLAN